MTSQKLHDALEDTIAIASTMEKLIPVAQYLTSNTGWTPQQLITAFLSYGVMHGWNIAQVMEKMYVLKGKIAYQASAMFGIAIASPKCESWKVLKNTDTECSLEFQRADNHQKYVVSFTIEMAQKQGLTRNTQWQNMPKQMLMARCKSMAVRDVFGDVISGYDAIELADSMDMSEDERLSILSTELDTPIHSDKPAAKTKKAPLPQPMPIVTPFPQPMPTIAPSQSMPAFEQIEEAPVQDEPSVVYVDHKDNSKFSDIEKACLKNVVQDDLNLIWDMEVKQTKEINLSPGLSIAIDQNMVFAIKSNAGMVKRYLCLAEQDGLKLKLTVLRQS
jgi:hypothetical protein